MCFGKEDKSSFLPFAIARVSEEAQAQNSNYSYKIKIRIKMKEKNNLTILSIETSCDDTCAAVLKIKDKKIKIISNVVSSQVKLHAKYGGVYPFLAKREHQKNLPLVFKRAMKSPNLKVNLIAVTTGPGLEPCLWTGVNFAKELAKKMDLPIVSINHIEAHILANFIGKNFQRAKNFLPAICLVVSGGHTQLILMKDFNNYKIIGETRDDAAGECFDKTARILGLGYPGGPAIAKQAQQCSSKIKNLKFKISFPRPMIRQKNYDFSFSGLKTAVLYDFKKRSLRIRKSKQYICEMAVEIQRAIIDVLIYKTLKAAKSHKIKSIILCGGVAANKELREQLKKRIIKETPSIKYLAPDIKYATDNAAMIGIAAYFNLSRSGKKWKEIKANANIEIGEKI